MIDNEIIPKGMPLSVKGTDHAVSLELTRHALIESYHQTEFIYGRWDSIFGAWERRQGKAREFLPSFLPNDVPNVFREKLKWRSPETDWYEDDPPVTLGDLIERAQTWSFLEYEEFVVEEAPLRTQFQEYCSLIPEEIRVACRGFGRFEWAALEACWEFCDFLPLIQTDITGIYRRLVTTLWTATDLRKLPRRNRRDVYRAMIDNPPRALVEQFLPTSASRPYLNILGRLNGAVLQEDEVAALSVLADRKAAVRCLHYLRNVPPPVLTALSKMPDWMMKPIAVEGLIRGAGFAREFCETLESRGLLQNDAVQAAIMAGLPKVQSAGQLVDLLEHCADRMMRLQPFPAAPLKASNELEEIRTARGLAWESATMNNCSIKYLDQILAGEVYFYRWHGDERATVALRVTESGRWRIFDIRAIKDGDPTKITVRAIAKAVARARPKLKVSIRFQS